MYRSFNQVSSGSVVWAASLLLWADRKYLYKDKTTQGIFKAVVIDLSNYGYLGTFVGYQHLQRLGLNNWENFFQINPLNVFLLNTNRDTLADKIDYMNRNDCLMEINKRPDTKKVCETYNCWLAGMPQPFFFGKSGRLAKNLTFLLTGSDPSQHMESETRSCPNFFSDLPNDVQTRVNGYYEKLKTESTRL